MKEVTIGEAIRIQVLTATRNSMWQTYENGVFSVFADKNTFYVHCHKLVDNRLSKVKTDTYSKEEFRLQIYYE